MGYTDSQYREAKELTERGYDILDALQFVQKK
jgi:hypothetical protein